MVAPLYNQVKDNAWNYLKHYARPLLAEEPREAELSVLLVNGAKIRLYGADNPDRLRGGYFDGVVLDEFADMKSDVWRAVVRPMLSDRKGWATIIGTPKGKNEFWRVYQEAQKDPDWFHMMLRASDSGIIPMAELEKLRIEQGEDFYQQEYESAGPCPPIWHRQARPSKRHGRPDDCPGRGCCSSAHRDGANSRL
jgi:phage terminase large subunit